MGFSPRSPQLIRGGIVLVDPDTGRALRIITLQYNPDTLTRSLQIKGVGGDAGDFSEAMRLKGPPVETIKLEAEIDATDQLEAADPQATQLGIHPQLALLETLVYPNSVQLLANKGEAQSGSIEIAPMQSPLTLFVWSKTRVLPVRVTEFSITEESFDTALNPIRAKVSLGMRVLTVDDLGFEHKGGSLFMSYLEQKEQLAARIANASFGALGITGIP
jgi:hypothetical protein